MSDEDKRTPSKSVMGNLPSTRPARMGRRRAGGPAANGAAAGKAKPRATSETEPKTATAKAQKAPAGKPKPAAAETAPKAVRPRAVRAGSPSLDAAKSSPEPPRRRPSPEPPTGTELVTTAVQATGELAKIGITLGGQALKRAVDRLPKP